MAAPAGPSQTPWAMREMQARVYATRAAQFILLKAPPAAGKSRALMFLALDKLENQGRAEGDRGGARNLHRAALSRSTDLRSHGFWARLGGEGPLEPVPVRRGRDGHHAEGQGVRGVHGQRGPA